MKNKILLISTLLAGLFILSSCLKDDEHDYWKDEVSGKMYATVLVPTLQSLGLEPVADDVEYSFMVNIATEKAPSHDVTITLAVDNDALTAYNTRTGKAYLLYPNIEILTPTVTILAGTRTAYGKFKVWGADALDACDNFIAPISIASVSDPKITISANMKTCMLALPIANPYAADYDVVGYRIRPGNPTEMISAGAVQTYSTLDCKTVDKNGFGNYSAYNIKIEVTATTMVVGGVTCYKVNAQPYDPATGADVGGMFASFQGDATVTNPAPPAVLTDINYYNPVTKQFVLNCWYPSTANRIMYEIATRK